MDVNAHKIVLKVAVDTAKFLPIYGLLQPLIKKKIVSPLATSVVIRKKEKNFSGVLVLQIQSIQIVFRVHIYPDSSVIQRLFMPDLLL